MGGVIGSLSHAGAAQNGVARPENVEPEEGRAGHRRVIEKHVPNSMSSSSDSSRLAKAVVIGLGLSALPSVVASSNSGNIFNCIQEIDAYQECNSKLLDFGMRAARCEGSLDARSYNKLETTQKRVVHEFCAQQVKQNATAEQMICEQQVELNNELEQTQEQRQEQISNLTAEIEVLQKQIQEMENKQTTVQLTVAQASAAAAAIGLPMLGFGAGIAKLCCSGKSKDKKETGESGQSIQPVQVPQHSEAYTAIPMEVVPVEVCEDDHRSE
ncbi:hypothetical protein [Endozoicomonas atrinae]|uniref:hypothetical protein n=1 Tax=Endozoicomonas atrinae TaxID=1333660 RepID=UPI003B002BB6